MPSDLMDRMAKLLTFIDAPNHADHPYNDAEREADEQGPDVARPPSVQALFDAGFVLEYIESVIPSLVANARADGETWKDIGDSLGMTRQAAQQRFGKPLTV